MAETDEVEVVARGIVRAVALGDDGVTHLITIDLNYGTDRVIWGCRGFSQSLEWLVTNNRFLLEGTSITCIDCIARGLP